VVSSTHLNFGWILSVAVTLVLSPLTLSPLTLADEPPQPDAETGGNRGQQLYQIYCSNCHGQRGLGDGPTAKVLKVKPTDLTRLAKRNKLDRGQFPAERVYKAIDGRQEVAGHGKRRMPIWGLAFQEYDRDTNQEAEVRFRILKLIDYLRSIQE
jgi:mono/diheme cytochrome c family protein